jgi:hypothetical protein
MMELEPGIIWRAPVNSYYLTVRGKDGRIQAISTDVHNLKMQNHLLFHSSISKMYEEFNPLREDGAEIVGITEGEPKSGLIAIMDGDVRPSVQGTLEGKKITVVLPGNFEELYRLV